MKIGLDFDNTIVCYDNAIRILSKELNLPLSLNKSKIEIRDYLRIQDRETEWTKFQGELYGPGINFANLYENCKETIKKLNNNQHELFIISHKTKYPYEGVQYNLHKFANNWIEKNISQDIIKKNKIYFLETLDEKINIINLLQIDIFIDDLPEVINHINFPKYTKGIIFDPDKKFITYHNRITNWGEIFNYGIK